MTRHTAAPLVDLAQLGLPRRDSAPEAAPTPALPPYALSTMQASAYLGVSLRTIRAMVADGRLPSFQIGDRRLIRRRDCEAYADDQITKGGVETG